MATWAVANSDANVNAVITVDSGSFATIKRADGNKQAFAEYCPDTCKSQDLTIPAADISKPGPPQWTAFVGANPVDSGINYAFGEADVLAIPMFKTLKDIGRTDITVIGYDADAEAVSLMTQPDSKYGATSGLPFTYAAWAGADLAMRQKAGAEMYDASSLPISLVDKDNAAQYKPYFAPPGDWRKTFTSLWQG
jgi:ribose transport system substrate-binding protein